MSKVRKENCGKEHVMKRNLESSEGPRGDLKREQRHEEEAERWGDGKQKEELEQLQLPLDEA